MARPLLLLVHLALLAAVLLLAAAWSPPDERVRFVERDDGIDVFVDGAHVTTYRYDCDEQKPCLHPVRALDGTVMTRGFPLEEVEGERRDHAHHTGVFFTYDHVNGTNFWYSPETPARIAHVEVLEMAPGEASGTLSVLKHWIDARGRVVLEEEQTMTFVPGRDRYAIDFTMTLTPPDTTVFFEDSKEGMFAIRVADWLTEEEGTGVYLSAEGEQTEEHIWGRRSSWVRLEGERGGAPMGVALLNHPESTNYPTYWHARGYGCFSANPLGQGDFQRRRGLENPTPLHLTLEPGQSAPFRFRMLVYRGAMGMEEMAAEFERYASD